MKHRLIVIFAIILSVFCTHTVFATSSVTVSSASCSNLVTNNLTATVSTDLSKINNTYDWRVNNVSIAVLDMSFNTNVTGTASGAVKDYSSYKNNGTLGGGTAGYAPIWNSTGKVGGGYLFDGINDYIKVNNNESLNICCNLTLEAWVKTNYTAGNQQIITKDGTGARSYGLLYLQAGAFLQNTSMSIFNSTGSETRLDTLKLINGNWHHIVGTYQYVGSGTSIIKIYVDGVLNGSLSNAVGPIANTTTPVNIGRREYTGANDWFNGTMDEVRIYNRTLTAQQVYQRYLETKDGYSSNSTIVSQELITGQNWTVNATLSNGTIDNDNVISNTITIGTSTCSGDTCTPTTGQNWWINALDNCAVTWKSYSVANITINATAGGNLTIQNSNITSTGCIINIGSSPFLMALAGFWTNSCFLRW